jgi:hypothetical protein
VQHYPEGLKMATETKEFKRESTQLLSLSEDEVSLCDGYTPPGKAVEYCGKEKDEDKPMCEECQEWVDEDARQAAEDYYWREYRRGDGRRV